MAVFLTNDWFQAVEKMTQAAGDLNLPSTLANLALNMNVSGGADGTVDMALDGGKIVKGLSSNAKATLQLDTDTLRKVFLEFDMSAAMQAFMSGKIKVQGDMTQLMALQTARPSPEQKNLFNSILAMTE
jgi:putative sterol carrier protein